MTQVFPLPRPDADSPEPPSAPESILERAPALLAAHGSPLFVLDEERLRRSYHDFRRDFRAAGLDPRIAYSYKTNYLPAVCAILHQEGAGAEIVSGMEYEFARALGVAPDSIVFNGPGKTRAELDTALSAGALVVVDGFDELDAVASLAAHGARPLRIGLRCDLGLSPWSRFGFRAESGDARTALERIASVPNLRLELLHHHAGTDHRDPAPYALAAQGLLRLKREAESLGLAPGALDLGGGFPANRPLAAFADAIAAALAGADVRLVVEPGRALVDPAMWLLCTVVAAKDIPGLGRALVADAGLNVLPLMGRGAPRPVFAAAAPGPALPTAVFGPLCMPEDRITDRAELPRLASGDALVIGEAGAYTLTQSTQFASPRPAVVLLGASGAEIVRRREDWRGVIGLCDLPERLRAPAAGNRA